MKITIIIPVYNEFVTIDKIVGKILKLESLNKQIIIVDDFSNDGTVEKLKKLNIFKKIQKIIFHSKNMGKGGAIKTAQKYIDGDLTIIQDADLEYDPNDFEKLIKPFIENQADVVYGSRFLGSSAQRVIYYSHRVANFLITNLVNIFTNINYTDVETGYKVFRKSILDSINLKEKSYDIKKETTKKISKLNPKIFEVGISYNGRT